MNATLKSICALLRQQDDVELQQAAIRVLGSIHSREPGIHKALGELLIETQEPTSVALILSVMEAAPTEHALRYLLMILERDDIYQEQVLTAIANIGSKAVIPLKRHFERVSTPIQKKIISAIPRIRTSQAHAFLVSCFFSPDHELVRQAVHSLREEIHNYTPKERSDLYQRLIAALKDKRFKNNDAALSAIIIALGILSDVRCKDKLLPFTAKTYPAQIRRHALMSLARLDYVGSKHASVFKALLPLMKESDYEGLVRHAVSVLIRIKPPRNEVGAIQALLQNQHTGVRTYALHALGQLDSITNAESTLEFLFSKDLLLHDAASASLRNMPSAVTVILRHLDTVKDRNRAFEMVSILESHGNRIRPDKARDMIKHMIKLYEADDDHYQLYRMALRHLRGDVLQNELVKIAERARKKKNFEKVRNTLKLLDHTELLTPDIRFQLAIAKLKTSKKDRARSFRLSDYCLEHIAHLLHDDMNGFKRKFLAERILDAEDILYVGFHFSERLNKERRFGADLLRYVIKKWPRKSTAPIARKKLKVEGH